MRIPGRKSLQRFVRPLMTTLRPGGLILGYHRIADVSWDPLGVCVLPSHFRQHLEILLDLFTPVSMRTLVASLRQQRNVQDMVALTFDDGYRDFIENAMPELDRQGIPATVFIATGFIDQSYWWDEIVCCLRAYKQASSELILRWNGPDTTRVYSDLTSGRGATRAVLDLCRDLSMCNATVRTGILEQLRRLGRTQSSAQIPPSSMSEQEIRELAESPNIEIGSHSMTHPMLARLAPAEQRQEIETSRRRLEAIAGPRSVLGFSYPNGSFSEQTCQLVAEQGFEYACTSQQDVVRKGLDLYKLPRLWAPNADHRRFRTWLSSWRGIRIETSSSRNSKHESAR